MTTQQSHVYNLALDEEEREELLQVLEQRVMETRDEQRHTDSAQYRDIVASEELHLQTLLEKVRRLTREGWTSPAGPTRTLAWGSRCLCPLAA